MLVLERAKAVLAAVAASSEIPCGAKVVHQAAVRKVLVTGDVDLLAMLLMWAAVLPVEPIGIPAAADGGDGVDVNVGDALLGAIFGGEVVDAADGNGVPGLEAVLGLHNDI